ncbi:MAG: terpene cyclase/mutase family protein, partial [Syntrophomonadaceae bacterium]|nr:terpene cyclase/mutase family protein [Syntrophomonadaceae bacterium]
MKILKKSLATILAFVFTLSLCVSASAANAEALDRAVKDTAAYMLKTVKNPEIGSVGGEWAVIGLARSGYNVPAAYYATYYKAVEQYVKDQDGILHEKKYTDYSRVILGLTAAGYDPRNIGGYDLTFPLGDFESTVWQGINGPVWALIALDSLNYPIPENKNAQTQATRELYVEEILKRQNADGSWSLTANTANGNGDPDLTGMSLQALAKYQDNPDVKTATNKALDFLSNSQDKSGGYTSWGDANSESVVQVLVALCELGISVDDARFVKNGHTLIDNILTFQNADGSFRHTGAGIGNAQMSSEQVLYGLVAAQRAANGQSSLYRMSDTAKLGELAAPPAASASTVLSGLPDKHTDVKLAAVIS